MPYKISGTKSETARIIVLKESDWSIESNTVVSGTGSYEIEDLETGNKLVFARNNDGWIEGYGYITSEYYAPLYPPGGDRGVAGGGQVSGTGFLRDLRYITISTGGNAVSFGLLTTPKREMSTCSNSGYNRGVFICGYISTFGASEVMEYITITSTGNAIDFGDSSYKASYMASTSNGPLDRGIHSGGGSQNYIGYITISTTGNSLAFGDLTVGRNSHGACSNNINGRAVFGGGNGPFNVIDYITIATLGDATDFGDLTVSRQLTTACSNGTNNRGVWGGGHAYTNTIDYITIPTTGNAQDFGDLTVARAMLTSTDNGTNDRGVFIAGATSSIISNVIDYITISSTGVATDFGDFTTSAGRYNLSATSNA